MSIKREDNAREIYQLSRRLQDQLHLLINTLKIRKQEEGFLQLSRSLLLSRDVTLSSQQNKKWKRVWRYTQLD